MGNRLEDVNVELINKYNVVGPYYTSYPTVGEWSGTFSHDDYLCALKNLFTEKKEISLYIHIPFCPKLCYYCICYTVITKDREKIRKFLSFLFREIDLFFDFLEKHSFDIKVKEIHIGGGSPSYLDEKDFDLLIEKLQTKCNLKEIDEFRLEIDVRTVTRDKLKHYHEKGINRISLGIQDYDPNVQKAINRVHSPAIVEELLSPEIRKYFKSINFDLIYGLPLQSRTTFRNTIETVKTLSPDRIALFNCCHTPERYEHQTLIKDSDIPSNFEKTMIFIESALNLLENGYEHIGIDHFAKPADDLSKAAQNKTLKRIFNGYTIGDLNTVIGIGPSSLSCLNNYYSQNIYSLSEYYETISQNKFPILRGIKLSTDDLVRRDIMDEILCNFSLDFRNIGKKYNLDYKKYFEKEINTFCQFINDGLMEFCDDILNVTPLGKLFVRNICMVFDNYLTTSQYCNSMDSASPSLQK